MFHQPSPNGFLSVGRMKKTDQTIPCGHGDPVQRTSGFALVLILGVLVLMLVAVLAFFSRAQTSRMLSSASASNQLVELVAEAAVDCIYGDLTHEMLAGSEQAAGAGRRILSPRMVNSDLTIPGTSVRLSTAPSMVSQRVVEGAAPPTLVKQSLNGRPFFIAAGNSTGWDNTDLPPIPSRASDVSTDTAGGGRVSPSRWDEVQLMPADSTISVPDWVYLDREGQTPAVFSPTWADRSASNSKAVIGRFAYNIYDVGGLLDLNVLGNLLVDEENGRRGRMHQVSLANESGALAAPNFPAFVTWRSANDVQSWEGEGALGDPSRTFLTTPTGTQRFPTRKDLLSYLSNVGTLPESLAPYATIFSREVSAPIFQPEPNRPLLPAADAGSSSPEELNPVPNQVRFITTTSLTRGSGADVEVPAGTPVMARRFPLGKLALLADPSTPEDDLTYFFGLERLSTGAFRYIAASDDNRIKRLDEVALEGREPNFFEVLQAVIVTGSLGRNAGNTSTIDQPRDSLRNLQVLQIGANIIDQWDEDDFPTMLEYPSGTAGEWLPVYGTENLPYINSMEFVGHSPQWNRNRLQIWMLFSVWNPHQNASQIASEIEGFRIIPASGRVDAVYTFFLNSPKKLTDRLNPNPNDKPSNNYTFGNILRRNDPVQNGGSTSQSIVDVNRDRVLSFPNTATYSEPTVLGGNQPASEDYAGGLLLNEITTSKADSDGSGVEFMKPLIPADPTELEAAVRNGYFLSNGRYAGVNDILEQILRDNLQASENREPTPAEIQNSKVPPDGTGFFGAKAFNYFRLRGVANNRPTFHLQYRPAGSGEWITYQAVERLFPSSTQLDGYPPDPQTRGQSSGFAAVTHGQYPRDLPLDQFANEVTLPSAANSVTPETRNFFGWRRWESATPGSQGASMVGAFKADPRTVRFGHNSQSQAGRTLGPSNGAASEARSIMSTRSPFSWPSASSALDTEGNPNWMVASGSHRIGPGVLISGLNPNPFPDFEWFDLRRVGGIATGLVTFAGLTRNIPEGTINDQTNPSRYRDRDGIIRPADGYLGAIPTLAIPGDGNPSDRPLILNRPFRSVGELGNVFRDVPWKSIDFFSRSSADLGLLDAFSIDEPDGETPLVAGKLNLNTAPAEVLAAVLAGTFKDEDGIRRIDTAEAAQIAQSIVVEREARGPFLDAGDLVRRALAPVNSSSPGVLSDTRKHEREAAIRTLAGLGGTRTWNLLLDLVVQSGQMRANATAPSEFIVRAERHYWVHLAIDRITGDLVDKRWEQVDD